MPTSTKTARKAAKKAAPKTEVKAGSRVNRPSGKKKAAKAPARPVTLGDKPAKNRHFLLDRGLLDRAYERCEKEGLALSDVLRYGIHLYGSKAPKGRKAAVAELPRKTLNDLKALWKAGDSDRLSEFMAALHRGGWTNQEIADGMVTSGAVPKMSRQAVSLRVNKAPESLSKGLPEVPERGPRRVLASPRKGVKGAYKAQKKTRSTSHDLAFRVTDEDYEVAAQRAKAEGAMMSGVLDNVLVSYLNGEYKAEKIKEFNG